MNNLIIDKVAVTLPLTDTQKDYALKSMTYHKLYQDYNGRVYRDGSGYRYHNNYQLEIVPGEKVNISMYPYDPSHNFSRIEYNPTNLKKEGRKKLVDALINIYGKKAVKSIYFYAPVTRLDVTLDVYNLQPNLYMFYGKARHSELNRVGDTIESQVIGSDSSNCRITMYDKNAERRHRGKDVIEGSYQRIEIRMRNIRNTMNNLVSNKTCVYRFSQIKFFDGEFFYDNRFSRNFLNIAYQHGLNYGLVKSTRNERIRTLRYLQDYQVKPLYVVQSDFVNACNSVFKGLISKSYSERFNAKHVRK